MSRLESSDGPRFTVATENENLLQEQNLRARPLSFRKEAIEDFDRERLLSEIENDKNKKITSSSVPSGVVEYLTSASLLFKEQEFDLAQNFYRSVLKIDPNNELAIRGAADCAAAIGHHEEAVRILQKLVEKHSSPGNYKRLGDELYELSYNEDAISAYLMALRSAYFDGEELFEIYKNLGNIFLRIGDPDSAEENYNKAYTLNPDSDILLVNFGSLALFRNEYDKALTRFREAVSVNDRNDKAWVGLAMIHREYGDSELAWANLEKALDSRPDNQSAIKLVADWAMKDNEIEKAMKYLDAYLNLHPDDAQISMWFAKFLYFSGRLREAQVEIEKALHLEPALQGGVDVLTVIRSEIAEKKGNAFSD